MHTRISNRYILFFACCDIFILICYLTCLSKFVCVEVLWPSQPNGVMLSAVSLPNLTFTGQA